MTATRSTVGFPGGPPSLEGEGRGAGPPGGRTHADGRVVASLTFAIPALLAFVFFLFRAHYVIDDAFITFRYSQHLAEGHGFVFNLGGQPVEGFTNLSWTILLAVGIALHLSPIYVSVYLGLLCGIGSQMTAGLIMKEFGVRNGPLFIALLVFSFLTPFWAASAMGLETGMAALLVALMFLLTIRGRLGPTLAVLGVVLFATRPELIALPMLLLVFAEGTEHTPGGNRRWLTRRRMSYAATLLSGVLLLELFRLAYFGSLIPNTITAKSPPLQLGVLAQNARNGLTYSYAFVTTMWGLGVAFLLTLHLMYRAHRAWICSALLMLWLLVTALVNGGDWMPFSRIFQVITPLLVVSLGVALEWSYARLAVRSRSTGRYSFLAPVVIVVAIAVWCSQLSLSTSFTPLQHPSLAVPSPVNGYHELANAFAGNSYLDGMVIGPEALGQFCFELPRVTCHDWLGLTNATVAKQGSVYAPTFGRSDPGYTTLVVRPDIFITHSGLNWIRVLNVRGVLGRDYRFYYLRDLGLTLSIKDTVDVGRLDLGRFGARQEHL